MPSTHFWQHELLGKCLAPRCLYEFKPLLFLKVLSCFNHANIIEYKESFLHDGKVCIVTSFCEDGDLFSRIRKLARQGEKFEEDEIMGIFLQVRTKALNFGMERDEGNEMRHRSGTCFGMPKQNGDTRYLILNWPQTSGKSIRFLSNSYFYKQFFRIKIILKHSFLSKHPVKRELVKLTAVEVVNEKWTTAT